MTGYARKKQKLLAYANHIKGCSHWQRFAATEQDAVIVGEVTRDKNCDKLFAIPHRLPDNGPHISRNAY